MASNTLHPKRKIDNGESPMRYVVPMHMDNYLPLETMEYGAFLLTHNAIKKGYEYMKDIKSERFRELYHLEELIKK